LPDFRTALERLWNGCEGRIVGAIQIGLAGGAPIGAIQGGPHQQQAQAAAQAAQVAERRAEEVRRENEQMRQGIDGAGQAVDGIRADKLPQPVRQHLDQIRTHLDPFRGG